MKVTDKGVKRKKRLVEVQVVEEEKTVEIPVVVPNTRFKIDMMEEQNHEVPKVKKRSRWVWGVAVFLGLVIVAGVLGMVYLKVKTPVKVKPVSEVMPTPVATSTPTPMVDKSRIVFEVLNGTSTHGLAAKTKGQLEDLGYIVILTGNATGKHTGDEIYLTADANSQKDLLMADLAAEFPTATYSGVLTAASTASARMIIGK